MANCQQALLALQACPVAAIDTSAELLAQMPSDGFPVLITRHAAGDVYYCGWASRRSFGASSWLVVRPDGNVLIDVPRWSAPLARRIKDFGGLQRIVLTHRDDVADHKHWARAFGAQRWIHAADADAAPEAERQVPGRDALHLLPDLQLIPTPGHTAGSMVAVLGQREQVLFSGDHLWWNPTHHVVVASKTYCWWDGARSCARSSGCWIWMWPGCCPAMAIGISSRAGNGEPLCSRRSLMPRRRNRAMDQWLSPAAAPPAGHDKPDHVAEQAQRAKRRRCRSQSRPAARGCRRS